MECQKHLFSLDEGINYLNCATKGPALIKVKEAGIQAIETYSNPYHRKAEDFFIHSEKLKKSFAQLIDCDDYQRIAIIPSVSYGMTNVVNNISFKPGDNIVVPDGQFPSNIYPWMEVAKEQNLSMKIIQAPDSETGRGKAWNEEILEAIDEQTKVVAIGNVFWSDGTLFDLKRIRQKTRDNNALLIVDGTQSVGALPFSIKEIQPDALICAGYKWLLGPYSLGLAYYSEFFDDNKFAELVNYQSEYRPKAFKYSVGESSSFILRPMLQKALDQILIWGVGNIQEYTKNIGEDIMQEIRDLGVWVEQDKYRSHHLFGLRLPKTLDKKKLENEMAKAKIHVAFRGDAIRVSPHVYNKENDLRALQVALKSSF